MKNLKKTIFAFLLIFYSNVGSILAQGSIGGSSLDGQFQNWFENIITALILLAGIVATAVLVFNAYLYITASGDEGRVAKATKGITYAIVGLIVAAISYLIVNFVIQNVISS